MAGKAGQIIPRGERTWLVRVFMGRDPESGNASTSTRRFMGPCGMRNRDSNCS